MDEEKTKSTKVTTEYYDIEVLAVKFETNALVLAGAIALNKWVKGRKLTEKEYQKAIKDFLIKKIGSDR